MFGKFLPRSTDFFTFFEQHSLIVIQSARDLLEMIGQDQEDQRKQALKIAALEKEADGIAHQCIEELHKTFITPIERNDIYRLITRMDDILDIIEDVAARIVTYRLNLKEREIKKLVVILLASVEDIQKVVGALRNKEPLANVQETIKHLHQLENDGDVIQRQAIGLLFDAEKDPINLIKWKEIYEYLEDAIDCCESVAHIVEGVMIENS